MRMGCILLAAGISRRYGGNKLLSDILGKPLIDYILEHLPTKYFDECVAVASKEEVLNRIKQHNIHTVFNDHPELGISRSIRLGIAALKNVNACIFCVADQPMLSQETILEMMDDYQPGTIRALSHGSDRGNPVIFPASLLCELASLKENESGKTVIDRHEDKLVLHETLDHTQLIDIDTPESMQRVIKLMKRASL